jgi:hypothetical protein
MEQKSQGEVGCVFSTKGREEEFVYYTGGKDGRKETSGKTKT